MILDVKTEKLKKLLSKAMKCVTNSKLFPITGLLGIYVYQGTIQLITHDGYNTIYTRDSILDTTAEGYVVVDAGSFNALILKLSADSVKLEFKEGYLEVKAAGAKNNGSYKFDIAYEEGQVVMFPDGYQGFEEENVTHNFEINYKDLILALNLNEAAVAKTSEVVAYTGAYFGHNKIITTNAYVACITHKNLFEIPLLLNYSTLKLLPILAPFEGSEVIGCILTKDKICFYDDNSEVFGSLMSQVLDFPGKETVSFLELGFAGTCKIQKAELIEALDRLNIFITPFDKNIIELDFKKDSLTLRSLTSNAIEKIAIQTSAEVLCKTDFFHLKSQVESAQHEVVTLKFGNDVAIALEEPLATHIISLAVVS